MIDNNENSSVFQNDEQAYYKHINTVHPKTKDSEVGISDVLYDNILEVGFNSPVDISSLTSLSHQATTRNELYNIYDTMCEDGRVGAVIQTYARDSVVRNSEGKSVWATSSNPDISYLVNYYIDSLNIEKNIYKWAFALCKYGDVYIRFYRESEYEDALFINKKKENLTEDVKINAYKKSDRYAHYIEMAPNPAEIFELTKFGKTVGFIKTPVSGVITRSQDNFNLLDYAYKFKKEDIDIYPPTEYVHAALQNNVSRFEETVNIFTNNSDYENNSNAYSYTVNRGQSLLANAYSIWRELQLLEASVLLNRVTKSSIVRLINVEVGDMPKENVAKVLMGIKQMIEQKAAINKGVGMTEYTNPGPIENNVYLPTHDGVGAISTTQIGGDVDVKGLADLDWYLDKLYTALGVPKQFFNETDDSAGFNGGQSLTIISSNFGKMIKYIQAILAQLVTDIINLILLDKNLDAYINNFEIHLQAPVTQEDLDRTEALNTKVQLTRDIMDMLQDVEDQGSKLKILKELMSDFVTNDNVIAELQNSIEKIEQQESDNSTEELNSDNEESNEEPIDINIDTDSSTISNNEDSASSEEEQDIILPSPEQLGVDIAGGEE